MANTILSLDSYTYLLQVGTFSYRVFLVSFLQFICSADSPVSRAYIITIYLSTSRVYHFHALMIQIGTMTQSKLSKRKKAF